jgi:hypothetical protein
LKKGEGLEKEQDDATLLANTYDPDDSKSSKNNKNRAKSRKGDTGE